MGRSRLELHAQLTDITPKVYYQPPNGLRMEYPCIVYNKSDVLTLHAGNDKYRNTTRYTVTVIDRDPDSSIPESVLDLPLCSYDRRFAADNLNHDVFTLYF
jgi:hypothetical protein